MGLFRLLRQNKFSQFFFCRFFVFLYQRVVDQPAQKCHALDQLGHALQPEQREANGHEDVNRPADQPAGIARHLARGDGVDHRGQRKPHGFNHEGKQKEHDADDVDPVAPTRRELAGEHVDAHMLVVQKRISGRQEKHRGEQIPLNFQKGVRAVVEDFAYDRIECADDGRSKNEPEGKAAHALVEPVNPAG